MNIYLDGQTWIRKIKSQGDDPDRFVWHVSADDDTAREWFEANVWKDGRTCGLCGSGNTMLSKHPTMPYRCVDCRRYFSVKVGTVMERSRIATSTGQWSLTCLPPTSRRLLDEDTQGSWNHAKIGMVHGA